MPKTRRGRTKATTQPTPKLEFGVTRGDIESCVAKLRESKYQWVTNFAVIVTTASEISATFLHELAECLKSQNDPVALSSNNERLYFNHAKIVSLSRTLSKTMAESVQTQCYCVRDGKIIDMPDTTVVVFPLQ